MWYWCVTYNVNHQERLDGHAEYGKQRTEAANRLFYSTEISDITESTTEASRNANLQEENKIRI